MSWFTAPCFTDYWKNYEVSMRWLEENVKGDNAKTHTCDCRCHHCAPTAAVVEESDHESDSDGVSKEYLEFMRQTEEHQRMREEAKIRSRKKHRPDESLENAATNYVSVTCMEDEHAVVETDEDEDRGIDDYLPVEKLSIAAASGTLLSSSSHDLKRSKAENRRFVAASLYGDDDDRIGKIFSLETALQVDFDCFIDNHKPKVWPVCPLNTSVLGLN